ncbi:hypothetical protein ABEY80_27305 [Priestia megaterium]
MTLKKRKPPKLSLEATKNFKEKAEKKLKDRQKKLENMDLKKPT